MEHKVSKIIRYLILVIILFCCLWVKAQTIKQTLYLTMPDAGIKTKALLEAMHIDNLTIIDNRYIDPGKIGVLNKTTLTGVIERLFPNPETKEIAILDWEGDLYDGLSYKFDPNSEQYKKALQAYIDVIKYAKTLRPNIKWGFYGMPFTMRLISTPWANSRWISSNNDIEPLLQQCDLLLPSLYINGAEPMGNEAFLKTNMQQFLLLAKSLNKLLIPFVWNRFYPSPFSKLGLKLIPTNEFNSFITGILSASYNNEKASGVILFGADNYFYLQLKDPRILAETTLQNYPLHHDSVMVNSVNQLLNVFKKQNSIYLK